VAADDLIYDLGLHHGDDTDFYLRKGFRVVALEAKPQFCRMAGERFAEALKAGRLVVVNKALARSAGQTATFYLSEGKDDWGSLDPGMTARNGATLSTIEVETTTLSALVAAHGVPYYLKSDIEGADEYVVEQLETLPELPRYVSVEASGEPLGALVRYGYDRFQIVNQGYLQFFPSPEPPREGKFAEQHLQGHISGLFGRELEPSAWADVATTATRLARWRELNEQRGNAVVRRLLKKVGKLTRRTWLIGSGWIDIHARLGDRAVSRSSGR
jgi:FkbM family methyltransferase